MRLIVKDRNRESVIAFRVVHDELWIGMESDPKSPSILKSRDFKPVKFDHSFKSTDYDGALREMSLYTLSQDYHSKPYAIQTTCTGLGAMIDAVIVQMSVEPRCGMIVFNYDDMTITEPPSSHVVFDIPRTPEQIGDFEPKEIIDVFVPVRKPLKPTHGIARKTPGPDGLFYFDNAVPDSFARIMQMWFRLPEVEDNLFPVTNASGKASQNSRRVLQYGYAYDYKSGSTREKIDDMPHIIEVLRSRIPEVWKDAPSNIIDKLNQCIVNRYLPGQGIGAHIDGKRGKKIDYGDTVVCFTFLSGREMKFVREHETHCVYTKPLSMYVMTGDSRYEFTHEMVGRKSDTVGGKPVARRECFSVTFREVL